MKLPLEVLHMALWVFHAQAKIVTYARFDRFLYACAAILVAMKLG